MIAAIDAANQRVTVAVPCAACVGGLGPGAEVRGHDPPLCCMLHYLYLCTCLDASLEVLICSATVFPLAPMVKRGAVCIMRCEASHLLQLECQPMGVSKQRPCLSRGAAQRVLQLART